MAEATYDVSQGTGIPWSEVAECELDCAAQNIGNGESAKVIHIPARTLLLGVAWEVETAEGATLAGGIGDSSGATVFGSAVDLNAATAGGAAASAVPKYYATANDIRVTMTGAADACVVKIRALMKKLG